MVPVRLKLGRLFISTISFILISAAVLAATGAESTASAAITLKAAVGQPDRPATAVAAPAYEAGSPVIADPLTHHVEVYAVGADHSLYEKWWNGSWSNWIPLGGNWISKPAALYDPLTHHVEVYAVAADHSLYEKWWNGSWSNWIPLGGNLTGDPAALYDPLSGHFEVYAVAADHSLYQKWWNRSWSNWIPLGGNIGTI